MTNDILSLIKNQVPRYSEEGSDASLISKKDLLQLLQKALTHEKVSCSKIVVDLIESVFSSLCLMDTTALQVGDWKFVSFPAQLCALSILHILADPQQRLLPLTFWQTANVSNDVKENQRNLLKWLEDNRVANHAENQAKPIRYVYVAWGIIKINGKILFHRREDIKERTNEKAGNYNITGGKAEIKDLRKVLSPNTSIEERLGLMQAPDSQPMFDALDETLYREFYEEIGLLHQKDHYQAKVWRSLNPYLDRQGTAPIYALTQYFIRLYSITLSDTGYFALQEQLKTRDHLVWCSLDEISRSKTDDGKTMYISALFRDFADNPQELKSALQEIEESYVNNYRFTDQKDSLILSLENDVLYGQDGKESALSVPLTPEQKSLLMGLGAHVKGLLMVVNEEQIKLHDFGWVEVLDEKLASSLKKLAELFNEKGLAYIENLHNRYFRLSLNHEHLFIDYLHFSYSLQNLKKYKWELVISRELITTLVGQVSEKSILIKIGSTLGPSLSRIINSPTSRYDDEDLPKKVRSALKDDYKVLGLKRLLGIEDSHYFITIKQAKNLLRFDSRTLCGNDD